MLHGTDNIIYGNAFDLRYIGTSEGSASRGYGAYLAENLDVAENYRHYGDKHNGDLRITIRDKSGKEYHTIGAGKWIHGINSSGLNGYEFDVFGDIYEAVKEGRTNLAEIKKELAKSYRREISKAKKALAALGENAEGSKNLLHDINHSQEKINVLKSLDTMSALPARKGNIYSFDGPENDQLLDWDKSKASQPELIKKAWSDIIDELAYWNIDNSELKKAKTGEQFYRALTRAMNHQDKDFAYPQSGITDPQQRASLILNMHGVPGLRFLDSGSRAVGKRKGATHNFVIWNTDTLKMPGVTGNPEAERHFRDTQSKQNDETFRQSVIRETNGAAMSEDDLMLAPEAQKQYDAVVKKYKDTPQWLKAPNGNDTNLTEKQWVLTRTENFINWFGDWINDHANASKVLDENGEPKVVYHGTENPGFSTFNTKGTGSYFSSNMLTGESYSFRGGLYPVFLNLRNPYILDAKGSNWNDLNVEGSYMDTNILAVSVRRGEIGNSNHDGVIVRNVIDVNSGENEQYDPETGQIILLDDDEVAERFIGDDFIVFNPPAIKSATRNNGMFSPQEGDVYQQSVGYGAAVRLDAKNGNHNYIDNLRKARRMEKKLKPDWKIINHGSSWSMDRDYSSARKIWQATGWYRGADGQWKMELPYGFILHDKFNDIRQNNITKDNYGNNAIFDIPLSSFFTAPQLFNAYPTLKDTRVHFMLLPENYRGYLQENNDINDIDDIVINYSLVNDTDAVRNTLIHEIQHWIQSVEGFASGGDSSKVMLDSFNSTDAITMGGTAFDGDFFRRKNYKRQADIIFNGLSEKKQKLFTQLRNNLKNEINARNNGKISHDEFANILKAKGLSDRDIDAFNTWDYLMFQIERPSISFGRWKGQPISPQEAYRMYGGEVEARNAERRSRMSEQERRNSFPLDTQDTSSEQQLIFSHNSNSNGLNGFMTQADIERFMQSNIYHGTGHIIFDNMFDLQYLGTGEGEQVFGYGIYLAENINIAESYRRMGITNSGFGKITITLSNGKSIPIENIHKQIAQWRNKDINAPALPDGVDPEAFADVALDFICQYLDDPDNWNFKHAKKKEINRREALIRKRKTEIGYEHNVVLNERAVSLLREIKSFDVHSFHKGNIYQATIPENYELLDWDKKLDSQPEQVKKLIAPIIEQLNSNPATFFAKYFSQFARNPAKAEAHLAEIISGLLKRYGAGSNAIGNPYEFRKLQEYSQLKRILRSDKNVEELRHVISTRVMEKIDIHRHTGEDLYRALQNLLGSAKQASMYLNSYGIPGHRYFDGGSRINGEGTHNFVIWDTSRLKLHGVEGDNEAVDYLRNTLLKQLTGNLYETQSTVSLTNSRP